MRHMTENEMNTVKDENILTERKFPRRSFLTATGALLAGAAVLASGISAVAAPQSDPDAKKKKKTAKKSKIHKKAKAKKAKKAKGSDPDHSRL